MAQDWWEALSLDDKIHLCNQNSYSIELINRQNIASMYDKVISDTMCSCGLLQNEHVVICDNIKVTAQSHENYFKKHLPDTTGSAIGWADQAKKLVVTNKTTMDDLKGFCGDNQIKFWTGVTKVITKGGADVLIQVDDIIEKDNAGFLTVTKHHTNKVE